VSDIHERSDGAVPPDHQAIAESLLGVPLWPDGIRESLAGLEPAESRQDIRQFALDATLRAVRQLATRDPADPEIPIQLTRKDRAAVQSEFGLDLRVMSRQVRLANNAALAISPAEHTSSAPPQSGTDKRNHAQISAIQAIHHHVQSIPRYADEAERPSLIRQLSDGILTVAPTGSGKTVIASKWLQQIGLGQQVSAHDGTPIRALGIVPSLEILHQYTGDRGDDTFRRHLGPDVKVSSWWHRQKDASGDAVIITKQSLGEALDSGAITPELFDVTFIDEAHHALEPKLLGRLGDLGARLLGFTATPAYNLQRDLRRYLSHVEVGSLRSFVEEGILNPVRLYSYRSDNNEVELAAGLAGKYIQEGRSVVVYCQPGEFSWQARKVADTVNAHCGRQVMDPVGSYPGNESDDSLDKFLDGGIRGLSTVNMLREGWNAPVDVVIVVGRSTSLLHLIQKIGRAMRPGDKETILAEIMPKPADGRPAFSIWDAFGLDEVVQGALLGALGPARIHPRGKAYELAQLAKAAGTTPHTSPPFDGHNLPETLRQALLPNQPVRRITLTPEAWERRQPPDGFVHAAALAEQYRVPLPYLHLLLDREDLSYVGIWPTGSKNVYERWYEPQAAAYLVENPPAALAASAEFNITDLTKMTNLPWDYLAKVLKELELEPVERLSPTTHRLTNFYNCAQLERLLEKIEAIPQAAEDDVLIGSLLQTIGHSFLRRYMRENDIQTVVKRRNPKFGLRGYGRFITAAQAAAIQKAADELDGPMDQLVSFAEAAKIVGIGTTTLTKRLTPEENEQLVLRHVRKGRTNLVRHVPKSMLPELVRRLQPAKLPPHLVPLSVICERTGHGKANTISWFKRRNLTAQKITLAGQNIEISCYTWAALTAFEEKYGIKPEAAPINYRLLASGPEDRDPRRLHYSQSVQRLYFSEEQLVDVPEPWAGPTAGKQTNKQADKPKKPLEALANDETVPLRASLTYLRCSPEALAVLLMNAKTPKAHLRYDADGRLGGITAAAIRAVNRSAALNILARPENWVSNASVAQTLGIEPQEVVELARKLNVFAADRAIFKLPNQKNMIDLCYSQAFARRMLQWSRAEREPDDDDADE